MTTFDLLAAKYPYLAAESGCYEPRMPQDLLSGIGLGAVDISGAQLHATGLDLAIASVWEYSAGYFELPLFNNRLHAAAEILRLLPLLEEEYDTLSAEEAALMLIEALDDYERALAAHARHRLPYAAAAEADPAAAKPDPA